MKNINNKITKVFDQLHPSLSLADEFPIGHIVVGNFLPEFGEMGGKVVSIDEETRSVTFVKATKEETDNRLKAVFSHLRDQD